MAATNYHLSVSVRGVLRRSNRELKRDHLKWMMQDDGTPYPSADALRDALMDELAAGHEVLSLGECDNFDPKQGCLGHPAPDPTPQQENL